MTYKLENGEYVISDSAVVTVELIGELLQNAMIALKTPRGRFYPNKDLGNKLRSVESAHRALYAASLARQALDGLDGVFVLSADIINGSAVFTLLLNDEERTVEIEL